MNATQRTFEDTRHVYQPPRPLHDSTATKRVRIVHISDTHGNDFDDIPNGDILVHTGDFTNHGTRAETEKFRRYLQRMQTKFDYMVVICGNHEMGYDRLSNSQIQDMLSASGEIRNLYFLQDSGATVRGVKFWGSTWNNCRAMAWSASPEVRAQKWKLIPADTDVLLTHNPPEGILDLAWVKHDQGSPCALCDGRQHKHFRHWGCKPLLDRIRSLRIPVHMFGHVHDQTGLMHVEGLNTTFSNAAMDIKERCSVIDVLVSDTDICTPLAHNPPGKPCATAALPSSTAESLLLRGLKLAGFQQPLSVSAPISLPFEFLPMRFCNVIAGDQRRVLDLDAHDGRRMRVLLWEQTLSGATNQLWNVVPLNTHGARDSAGTVTISSAWANTKFGTPDRWLGAVGDGEEAFVAATDQIDDSSAHWRVKLIQHQPPGAFGRGNALVQLVNVRLNRTLVVDDDGRLKLAADGTVPVQQERWTLASTHLTPASLE